MSEENKKSSSTICVGDHTWRRGELCVQAGDLEEVLSQDDGAEGVVAQEDVDGAGVGDLAGVVGLVLLATPGLHSQLTGVVHFVAVRGHEISASDEPVLISWVIQ